MNRIVIDNWSFTGGYGWSSKTNHAYIYKYTGSKPQPVKSRWMLKGKKADKTIKMYFGTQHEALTEAVKFLF